MKAITVIYHRLANMFVYRKKTKGKSWRIFKRLKDGTEAESRWRDPRPTRD
jgi:hypothetical protein